MLKPSYITLTHIMTHTDVYIVYIDILCVCVCINGWILGKWPANISNSQSSIRREINVQSPSPMSGFGFILNTAPKRTTATIRMVPTVT